MDMLILLSGAEIVRVTPTGRSYKCCVLVIWSLEIEIRYRDSSTVANEGVYACEALCSFGCGQWGVCSGSDDCSYVS